jgi:hypothetical protein
MFQQNNRGTITAKKYGKKIYTPIRILVETIPNIKKNLFFEKNFFGSLGIF